MRLLRHNQKVNWADPKSDYARIVQLRAQNLQRVAESQGGIPALLAYYGDGHWAEFISDWGMTFDPRETDPELMYRPFILYKRQIEYVDWVYQRYVRKERGLCKKFRGAGASWLDAAIAAVVWLTVPNSVVTLGSQKSEKVDNGDGDPDSLLWKVRKFVELLPALFQPAEWQKAGKLFNVPNPTNGAVIRGEIGDQIGRGGRASIVFADEFAELEHPQRVESALAETANTVLYVSTIPETGYIGSKFYELEHHLPDEQVFVWHWWQDERKRLRPDVEPEEEEWYKKKKQELSPAVFDAQFLLTNTSATTNAWVGGQLIQDAFGFSKLDVVQPADVGWCIGVDASGMGQDKSVVWCRRGRISIPCYVKERMDGIQLARFVTQIAEERLDSAPVELIGIEQDGPGGSCADQLKYGRFKEVVAAVHTGARLADGANWNLRAWLHRQAKQYLEDGCSIPRDDVFEAQATAIQHEYKGGKLLIESKEEYRARMSGARTRADKKVGKSPDRWDAFVLTFIPPVGEPVRQYSVSSGRGRAQGWKPLDNVVGY